MLKRQLLKIIAKQICAATEEEATARRFFIMGKALHLLSPEDRKQIDRIIRIERKHLSPRLEEAWRKSLQQAEEEGITPEEISSGQVESWHKAVKQAEKELGLAK